MFFSCSFRIELFNYINFRLQQEIFDLKLETGNQKKLIREQKEIIDRFQKNQSVKNAQVSSFDVFFRRKFIIFII